MRVVQLCMQSPGWFEILGEIPRVRSSIWASASARAWALMALSRGSTAARRDATPFATLAGSTPSGTRLGSQCIGKPDESGTSPRMGPTAAEAAAAVVSVPGAAAVTVGTAAMAAAGASAAGGRHSLASTTEAKSLAGTPA